MLFSELSLKPSSMKAIEAMGFETPSEIQEKSIPILMGEDVDFIGQAQTGTGKTAAFTLPLLEKIDLKARHIQALIIAPTRELANQICEEIKKLSKFEAVRTLSVYGGVPISSQLRSLRNDKPQIIVGTPGRLLDVIGRGAFDLLKCKYVVLDEADEMLDMGFFEDVQDIIKEIPEKKIWMFSATMPKPILNMINKHFCNPQLVRVTKKILTSDSVDQKFCVVGRRDQAEALCRFLDFTQDVYGIVFCRTKVGAKELTDELNVRGFPSDSLHGDMSQEQRDLTMKKFKAKKINLLVCTDVAARGIDVTDLTHVINYSLPQDNESYVHRIGRTGRAGSRGIALSIIESSELRRISQIERITKAKIEKVLLPQVDEIVEVLTNKALAKVDTQIEHFKDEGTNFDKFKERFADKSSEEILKGLYSFIFDQSIKRYSHARNLDYVKAERNERGVRGETANGAQAGYERFHMTVGKAKGLNTGALIRLVADKAGITGSDIGKISVLDDFSFFEVPDQFKDQVLGIDTTDFNGSDFSIVVAKGRVDGGERRGGRRNGNRSAGFSARGNHRGGAGSGSARRSGFEPRGERSSGGADRRERAASGDRSRSRTRSSSSSGDRPANTVNRRRY